MTKINTGHRHHHYCSAKLLHARTKLLKVSSVRNSQLSLAITDYIWAILSLRFGYFWASIGLACRVS